jgi:hypothetical protein
LNISDLFVRDWNALATAADKVGHAVDAKHLDILRAQRNDSYKYVAREHWHLHHLLAVAPTVNLLTERQECVYVLAL